MDDIRNEARDTAVDLLQSAMPTLLVDNEKPYTFYLPLELHDKTVYIQIGITMKSLGSDKTPAFTPCATLASVGVKAYREMRDNLSKVTVS